MTPYALLQLTGAYYQRRGSNTPMPRAGAVFFAEDASAHGRSASSATAGSSSSTDATDKEFLSARICEHPVFMDTRLWEDVLEVRRNICTNYRTNHRTNCRTNYRTNYRTNICQYLPIFANICLVHEPTRHRPAKISNPPINNPLNHHDRPTSSA